MKFVTRSALSRTMAVVFVSLFLASCGGGSSSGDDPTLDGSGDDPSLNPDGTFDPDGGSDPIVPLDGIDGDHDGDSVLNADDLDFVDDNFNGIHDGFEDTDGGGVTDPVDLGPCLGGSGVDGNSSNADWSDNCHLSEGAPDGVRNSSYTRGTQRILSCLGYDVATDGSYGPLTAGVVQQFQEDNPPLGADGIVGPMTWGALQDSLVAGSFDANTLSFSVDSNSCFGIIQFFQALDPATGDGLGFTIAEEPGSTVMQTFGVGF